MATKKKTRKKQASSKKTAGKKAAPAKKKMTPSKKAANKKAAPKKAVVKTKAAGKKTTGGKTTGALKKQVRRKSQSVDTLAFSPEESAARSGRQSGDLQGMSSIEGADSESVGELLEEGNAFEADAVTGVEDAENAYEKEVHTHEVPEDDVPGEYRDKD
jgi:hypothetical protein